ncbi:MAG: DUF5706 domain-containing protein [Saprospiraceae bacterium]|jgi:hypothetical protein|nr:DUF5706 domain-containing protein [Saprospiraceae bacterium]
MSRELHSPSEEIIAQTDIASLAQQFVLNLFNQKNDARLVFRTYRQTMEIVKTVNSLAQANGSTEAEWETAALAAWFCNAGYLFDYQNPEPKSIELAEKFFNAHQFSPEKKASIIATLRGFFNDQSLRTVEGQLLSDAVNAVHFSSSFFENSPLMRLEQELLLNRHFTKEEWEAFQMQQLLNVRFYTSPAKLNHEPVVGNHILALKERLDKRKRKEQPQAAQQDDKKFQGLKDRLSPGAQTFFRTNYRTHINLSAIADQKANIMISVNAILISVMISVISYRNMTETNPAVLMPVVIFLVTGLSSLIFAVLAARPKVTSLINDSTPIEEAKRNLMFFGNFVSLKSERYEELMDEMFRDSDLLYGNMTRDLYNLGKVLDRKYRFLSISYNIFMVGFVATVLLFMVVLFS